MPWKESDAMKERTKFVLEWEKRWKAGEGIANVAQLCREFGISRETGYVWLRRFRDAGHDVRSLEERSRRPHTTPTAYDEDVADVVAAMRKRYPTFGPRKLRVLLCERHADIEIPSASTIATILRGRGLSQPRKRVRRHAPPRTQPFAHACVAARRARRHRRGPAVGNAFGVLACDDICGAVRLGS